MRRVDPYTSNWRSEKDMNLSYLDYRLFGKGYALLVDGVLSHVPIELAERWPPQETDTYAESG